MDEEPIENKGFLNTDPISDMGFMHGPSLLGQPSYTHPLPPIPPLASFSQFTHWPIKWTVWPSVCRFHSYWLYAYSTRSCNVCYNQKPCFPSLPSCLDMPSPPAKSSFLSHLTKEIESIPNQQDLPHQLSRELSMWSRSSEGGQGPCEAFWPFANTIISQTSLMYSALYWALLSSTEHYWVS